MFRGVDGRPWRPPAVARRFDETAALAWLVVEELDGSVVRLLVLSWPVVDAYGSLVFEDREPARRLGLPARELTGADSEPPQVGAVFAARLAADGESGGGDASPGSPFAGRPLDVTAEVQAFARAQARAAGGFADPGDATPA